MTSIPMKNRLTAALAGIYGLTSIGFGIYGFILTSEEGKPSYASLIAGGVAGVILLACAVGMYYRPLIASLGAAVVSIALLGRFMPAVVHYMNGSASEVKPVALVMTVGGLIVLLVSALALGSRCKGGS
jgi:hypothetical protein